MSIHSIWILAFPKSRRHVWARKTRYAAKKSTTFEAKCAFIARSSRRSSPSYVISPNANDIMRKWANFGPFWPEFRGAIFMDFAPQNALYRLWYVEFRMVRLTTGRRQARATSLQFIHPPRKPITWRKASIEISTTKTNRY